MPRPAPAGALTCTCGKEMRSLSANLYQCPSCGRSRWGDESIPGGLIVFIIILTIVLIIVLGLIGSGGSKYRA